MERLTVGVESGMELAAGEATEAAASDVRLVSVSSSMVELLSGWG